MRNIRRFLIVLGTLILAMTNVLTVGMAESADVIPDTYTHATMVSSKEVLEGENLENALKFLADNSHYFYIDRATPYHGDYHTFPELGFDTEWRSPVNGRVYRGPYNDPLTKSVNWLTTNPNGSINSSLGSYYAIIPPNTDLELPNNEVTGYEKKDVWQAIAYMAPGQSVENFIRNGRGTLMIDAALLSYYGLDAGWQERNMLSVEVKLTHYERRAVTPQQYYDGLVPTTTTWSVPPVWKAIPGWGADAGENQFRTMAQFWGCATGDAAALNLNSDEERAAYIERANNDPALLEALTGVINDLHFEIMQVVNVKQELGFDFEQTEGKVNGLDMDGDGLLDRYPEGHEKAGELILQNAYGRQSLPEWAYGLNFNLDWWVATDGSGRLFNAEGRTIVGANPDGTYILAEESAEGAAAGEEAAVELAENEKLGSAQGLGGELTVKVTMDGDKIAAVEVIKHNETAGVADPAIAQIPIAIVEQNSAKVDAVAGATITSNAIMQAVESATAK